MTVAKIRASSVGALIFVFLCAAQAHNSYDLLPPELVRQRLEQYKGDDSKRETNLKTLFENAGCDGKNLSEQAIKGRRNPNVICVLPGESDRIILVGAHYDHVDRGLGVVDNWSSASLLPTLYEGLKTSSRKHTFIFISFAYEENGLVGSHFYADHLSTEDRSKIDAMINMDTLGLGPTAIWASHSDQPLLGVIAFVARKMNLPLTAVNVDQVGTADSESFATYHIPRMTIHSVTQETLHILHSPDDNMKAMQWQDYLDSYHLIAGYLASLDLYLAEHPVGASSPDSGSPQIVRATESALQNNLVYMKRPVYPLIAKRNHHTGTVVMDALIGKDGTIKSLSVIHSAGLDLDQAALDAVRDWRYKPYLVNGQPVNVQTNIRVNFYLQ